MTVEILVCPKLRQMTKGRVERAIPWRRKAREKVGSGIKLSLGQSGEGQRSEKQERSKERDGRQVTWEGALVHT